MNTSVLSAAANPWSRLRQGEALGGPELLQPGVRQLGRYHLDRSSAVFKLDQNEPPWELPAEVKQRVARRWETENWGAYPDFHADQLRARLGQFHGVDPAGVLVGNGSNELLATALTAFSGPGSEVLGLEPSFGLYRGFVAKAGATYRPVALRPDRELPFAALIDAVGANPTCPVLLCSPNNPTGAAFSVEQVEALLELSQGPVLLDNAYGEFCRYDYRELLARHPHLLVFRTFSKAWALAAARIGYLLASPAICEALIRVKLPYNLDRWSAIAAEEALSVGRWVDDQVADLLRDRDRWAELLRSAAGAAGGLEVFESEANFLLVRVGGGDAEASQRLFDRLAAGGVLVRDVGGYAGLAGCVRISIGSPAALQRLREIFEGVQ